MNIMLEKVRKDGSLMMKDLVQQRRKVKVHVCDCRGLDWRCGLGMHTVG